MYSGRIGVWRVYLQWTDRSIAGVSTVDGSVNGGRTYSGRIGIWRVCLQWADRYMTGVPTVAGSLYSGYTYSGRIGIGREYLQWTDRYMAGVLQWAVQPSGGGDSFTLLSGEKSDCSEY